MDEPRARADARLEEALAGAGVEDPRIACRDRLKILRTEQPAAFAQALAYFESSLVPAIADGGEPPLDAWIGYGRFIAERGGPGRTLAVDGAGRAAGYEPPAAGRLVIFVPEDGRRGVTPLLVPAAPSPAQKATFDLLVRRRREL